MTSKQFFSKVAEMREAQRSYYKSRNINDLRTVMVLEKEIDKEIGIVKQYIRLHPDYKKDEF